MIRENFFILTGAFGSGKTTLVQHLRTLGVLCIPEPAREILAEQRRIDGNGLPQKDSRFFVDLMLSRMMYQYSQVDTVIAPVIFDRGVPDMLSYASISGFDYPPGENAAQIYRYNSRVFFAPAWEEIYTTDDERTVSFEVARPFGDNLRTVYKRLGYTLVELPCVSVEERAAFILSHL